MSYGLSAKFSLLIASIYNAKLNGLRFLNGIGGVLCWHFLAGTLISWVFSSYLYNVLRQMISGMEHLAKTGTMRGYRFYNLTSIWPWIA